MLSSELFILTEFKMEYVGLLALGAALVSTGLRCYFSVKRENVLEAEEPPRSARRNAARAKRAQEALTRRLLRYHQGLSQA